MGEVAEGMDVDVVRHHRRWQRGKRRAVDGVPSLFCAGSPALVKSQLTSWGSTGWLGEQQHGRMTQLQQRQSWIMQGYA